MSSQTTVLIVEDEAPLRNLWCQTLRRHGYLAITAATVQDAEEIKQQLGPGAIDVVVTDVNLSDDPSRQEGYALFQRWTAASPAPAFVLISGAASSQTLPAVRSGAVRLLVKPFPLTTLLDAVRALLDRQSHPSQS